jgi:DNA-nicking Smr family endonuclease
MPRRLSDEDRDLWHRVARTTRRLQPSPAPTTDARRGPVSDPGAPPRKPESDLKPLTLRSGTALPPAAPRPTLDLASPIGEELSAAPLRMDRRKHSRMIRGKLDPEARIDLHGLTLAEAQPALASFILSSRTRGLRLVLVITGKGRTRPADDLGPIPRRPGALKVEVPRWLRSGPLALSVLEVREAHHRHGGTGAYYVYLRRPGG